MVQPWLPGPCLSSRATVHLPWQSAALATVCFAYARNTPGSSQHSDFPGAVFYPALPPRLFCSHVSRFPWACSVCHIISEDFVRPEKKASARETTPLPPQTQEAGTAASSEVNDNLHKNKPVLGVTVCLPSVCCWSAECKGLTVCWEPWEFLIGALCSFKA